MNWPQPMPITDRPNPSRLEGHPYSADVLVWDANARPWFVATFMFDGIESKTGCWSMSGEVVESGDVTHWIPLPPAA